MVALCSSSSQHDLRIRPLILTVVTMNPAFSDRNRRTNTFGVHSKKIERCAVITGSGPADPSEYLPQPFVVSRFRAPEINTNFCLQPHSEAVTAGNTVTARYTPTGDRP